MLDEKEEVEVSIRGDCGFKAKNKDWNGATLRSHNPQVRSVNTAAVQNDKVAAHLVIIVAQRSAQLVVVHVGLVLA